VTLWMLSQLALAAPEPGPEMGSVEQERRWRLPPVRLGGAAAWRTATLPAAELEVGVQPWRSPTVSLEVYARYQAPQTFLLFGEARRDMRTWSGTTSLLIHLSPLSAIGPEVGLGGRSFQMQWSTVAVTAVPTVAAVAQIGLVRTNTWGLALTARAVVEPVPTKIALPTQEVVPVSPVQVLVGTRLLLGHGRVHGERM